MKTVISVDNLTVFARHGVLERELIEGNDFEVEVSVEYDFLEAAEKDDIELTLNYAVLTDVIKKQMAVPRKLIETVALSIQKEIMERWPSVTAGKIVISKLRPPIDPPAPRASVVIIW